MVLSPNVEAPGRRRAPLSGRVEGASLGATAEPPEPERPPPRRPTVQPGRRFPFGGLNDDRWDGTGGTVEGPAPGWFGRPGARRKAQEPQDADWPAPHWSKPDWSKPDWSRPDWSRPDTPDRDPGAAASPRPDSTGVGRYAVPLMLLAFGVATASIVLPLIGLVVWLQRRKLFKGAAPPWEDPARVRAWVERAQARQGGARLPAPLARWLADPPYADPAAFRAWINLRLLQGVLALCGVILILRALSALAG